ncbi:MAG: penicillin-binding protein 2, partial [Nitrospira sp. SB0661_bin_20]|nr:penicillin-binding protein 2 [Nitrospira sp. SB0661_bin_20]
MKPGITSSGLQSTGLADIQGRLLLARVVVLIIVGLLVVRLWQLQVRDGVYYRNLSHDNRTRSVVLHPVRGFIYDRNGVLLANSVPIFNLYVELGDVSDREALIGKLVELLSLERSELTGIMDTHAGGTPVRLKKGVSLKEAAIIESHRLDLPGVVIRPEFQRNNPEGGYAAHVLGYVGVASEEQLTREAVQGLPAGSVIGQYGVERIYEKTLRGHAGRKLIEVDALGHEKRMISVDKPQVGNDVYLTIDFRLQKLAEDLLGEEAGAIVALDPQTGDVLAMASRPSFDPNALSRGLRADVWNDILQDKRHPLTNRAIQGQYPPGSTFKIITAAAALDTNEIEPADTLHCEGRFRLGRRTFRDWKKYGHGEVNLRKAIAQSCDVYFYRLGYRMGVDTIAFYAGQFGLGERTGIDLPAERTGLIPSSEWKKRTRGEPWYPGETTSVAIGQGYVTVTPLQMAKVIGMIGNNGTPFQPHVLRGVWGRKGEWIDEWSPTQTTPLTLPAHQLETIQAALAAVVTEGTARESRSSVVTLAGKTGTAQVVSLRPESEEETPKRFRDHAWFVAYAPFERPRIAVAVLVEHMGHGGSAAAPLAKELIETNVWVWGGAKEP